MILTITIPTHIGVYKLFKNARTRVALNLVRQRRNFYDQAGIKIERIIFKDEKGGLITEKPVIQQPELFPI